MILTYAVPCHSRLADLRAALPSVLEAANASPPVEILLIDYAAPEPLGPALGPVVVAEGNTLRILTYRGRDNFHCTHARNLGIRHATGDYVMAASADTQLDQRFFVTLRGIIAAERPDWLRAGPEQHPGFIVGHRAELVAAGGYDERMEFYGPDDKDLQARLERRRGRVAFYPYELLHDIKTPREQKATGYRLPLSIAEMAAATRPVYEANTAARVLVANVGVEWGAL